MADEIKAGVVLVQKFCQPGTKVFKEYIEYLDKEEKVRAANLDKFNLIDNHGDFRSIALNGCSALFDEKGEYLSQEQKQWYKERFEMAQNNRSVMWQTVISFDNRWLAKVGVYDPITGALDDVSIITAARLAMKSMKENENLEFADWVASIHYNTDNIHVHIAMVDTYAYREKMPDGSMRGKMKQGTLDSSKSEVVNNLLKEINLNKLISEGIRGIQTSIKQNLLQDAAGDRKLMKMLTEIHQMLIGVSRKYWIYGYDKIEHIRPFINKAADYYVQKYYGDVYSKYMDMLKKQYAIYREAYGGNEAGMFYLDNKMTEQVKRFGNAVLTCLREYDKNVRADMYNAAKFSGRKISQKTYSEAKSIYESKRMMEAVKLLDILMKDEVEHWKNQMAYQMDMMKRDEKS